jgi:phospholipid/cholesterol/gamma-HCH transport system substrate-binding protein
MKQKRTINNIKLGAFVVAGALFLVFSLYMIGRNRNLFGPTFTLSAYFRNINGLVAGNNVRFSGIDVGTVKQIKIVNDSSVLVVMVIDKKLEGLIKENALASVGTDGLVGNRIVNINSIAGHAQPVKSGSVIEAQVPVETDEMLRTLQTTNDNIAVITENLKQVSVRLSGSSSLWNILADTVIVRDLKDAASHFNQAGANSELATNEARLMVRDLRKAKGLANSIFQDTSLRDNLVSSISEIRHATRSLDTTTRELRRVVGNVSSGAGPVGLMLSDTVSSRRLSNTLINIEQGTGRFNENMEAMKHNWLFRKYFKDQQRDTLAKGTNP